MSPLLTLLLLSTLTFAQDCKPKPEKPDQPADFICSFKAEVTRSHPCALKVVETFVYPETLDLTLFRAIPALDDVQEVSDIKLFRDDDEQTVKKVDGLKNEVRIELPMEKNSNPVTFRVEYVLRDGVMVFENTCDGVEGETDANDNIFRWRRGTMTQDIDLLEVQFEVEEGKISPASEGGVNDGEKKVTFRREGVKDEVEFYVREEDVQVCPVELECFVEVGGFKWWIIVLAVLGGAALVVVVWVLIVRWRAKRKEAAVAEVA